MRNDLYHNVKGEQALIPAQVTGSVTGATIDVAKYESLKFTVNVGAVATADASNYLTVQMYEGDASDMSDETLVTTDLFGDNPVINATTQANSTLEVGYKGVKRYGRLKVVETGTADATFGATAELGHPHVCPVERS